MENRYAAWIAAHIAGDAVGSCADWTLWMQEAFPELRRVRGHARPATAVPGPGEPPEGYPHWWLATADHEIVDPTAAQFPWTIAYVPWQEGTPEPTGKCYECGAYCYEGKEFCNEAHRESYTAALMGMIR